MIIGTSLFIILKKRTWGSVFFLLGFSFTIFAVAMFELEQLGSQDTLWGMETTLLFILLDFIFLLVVFSNQIRQTFVKNNQLQEDLAQSKLAAANALLEGQLEERRRLSQELHDGISIKLALLKMKLSSLFSQKTKEQTQLLESVGHIAKDIRAFTHAISPLNLERQTLAEAIEDLIFQIENQTELNVQFELNQFEETQLESIQKHAIFQSIQELFNNTIKYAEASQIGISLSQNGQFLMTYEDDGKGFDTNKVHSGMGLKNIQSRAHLLNGNFIIYSSPKGSRFEFSL
jgi:signal transduction histidine kinase